MTDDRMTVGKGLTGLKKGRKGGDRFDFGIENAHAQ
jgi:hypothetical protein